MEKKVCSKCGEEKLLTEFYKHYSNTDKLQKSCKICYGLNIKKWRNKNKDKARFIDTKAKRKHRKNNPEKQKARRIITGLLFRGKLKREPCKICGKKKVEAHHDDYSKPLEVTWFCRKHHLQRHGCLKEVAASPHLIKRS